MTRSQLTLPTREERDHLLATIFGNDPKPPACTAHTNPKKNIKTCDVCAVYTRWWFRMVKKFNSRGLRFALDDRTYGDFPDDPQPPDCPLGHTDVQKTATWCEHCAPIRNWRSREYDRDLRAGRSRTFRDLDKLREHIAALRSGDMTDEQIGARAGCAGNTISRIMRPSIDWKFLRADIAERILAIPLPERRFVLTVNSRGVVRHTVDATGTRRRVQAACLAGHSLRYQADRLGYSISSLRGWLTRPTLFLGAAADVQELFPTLIARPGNDTAAIALGESQGWLPARYFSADNIDDPNYEPMRALSSPAGVRRRLRALAWMAHGPDEVAAFIDEKPETVRRWTIGHAEHLAGDGREPDYPVPAYALHLTDAAFEALSGRFGPDEGAAREARERQWAPPLAWYDLDIDDHRARPLYDLPARESKSNYPLQSQVLQALMGIIPASDLVHDEKYAVVRMLHHIGWSDRRIGTWLRWSNTVEKAGDGVMQFRRRWKISGGPRERQAWFSPTADLDFIVTPAAA